MTKLRVETSLVKIQPLSGDSMAKSEFVEAVGTLLANFSLRNAAIASVLILTQCLRMVREESLLSEADSAYAAYRTRVQWRVLPGIF